jgi:hypothetical protein
VIRRGLMFWTAIAASFGLPYSFFNADFRESVSALVSRSQQLLSSSDGDENGSQRPTLSISGEEDEDGLLANSPYAASLNSGAGGSLSGPSFPDLAQASPTYADYTAAVARTPTAEIGVHALALLGSGNAVRRLTRHLPALTDPDPVPVPVP